MFRFSEYDGRVIRSFADKNTERLFTRQRVPKFQRFEQLAWRKLQHLEAAASLDDLGAIPGNQLEKLVGDRKGQYSIRINGQYRICFRWADDGPHAVEIVDYH
jgi:proteic killer suppression protein